MSFDKAIGDKGSVLLLSLGPNLEIDSWCHAFERARTSQQASLEPFLDYVHPHDARKLQLCCENHKPSDKCFVRLSPKNLENWVWFEIAAQERSEVGQGVDLIATALRGTPDSSEKPWLKEIAELRHRVEAQAKALNQSEVAQNHFLGNMSHELRTPLTAVLGLSEALEIGLYGDISDEQQEAVHTINQCGKSLLALINDILDVTKLETRQVELQDEVMQVGEILFAICRLHKRDAAAKQVELATFVPEGDIAFVADRKRLKQLLSHLVSNAIKFTPAESQVEIYSRLDQESLILEVRDRGPGISPEKAKLIFEPFRQLDEGLARHYGGAGLGLSLVNKIVELIGGEISVHQREGGGAIFRLSLPYRSDVAKAEPELDFDIPEGSGQALVVDDHAATSGLLRDTLGSWGFEVEVLESVAEFQSVDKQEPVRLIVMDGKLPDGNGLDCIGWIRQQERYKHTPVIFISAFNDPEIYRAGLDAGAQAYLEKPVHFAKLASCVSGVLSPDLI